MGPDTSNSLTLESHVIHQLLGRLLLILQDLDHVTRGMTENE